MDEIAKAVRDIVVHLALNQVAHAKRMRRGSGTFQEAQAWQNEETEVCALIRKLRFAEMREEEKAKRVITTKIGGTD